MLAVILIVIIGIFFGFFATTNTDAISIHLGQFTIQSIPIYLAILVSLGIGLVIPALYHFLYSLSKSLTINEKEDKISTLKSELVEMTKKAHTLEIENTKLKTLQGEADFDDDSI